MPTAMDPMIVNLMLVIIEGVVAAAAAILVTRRYRAAHAVALRFLMLGFWLLSISVALVPIEIGLDMLLYRIFLPSPPAADTGQLQPLMTTINTISRGFSVLMSLLNAAGILLLAYGAVRIGRTRRLGFARRIPAFGPEIEELALATRPPLRRLRHWLLEDRALRWLRHWLLEDPGLE